jgi:hypothetical protein
MTTSVHHAVGLAVVQKCNVMAAMNEMVQSLVVPGIEGLNMCLRSARVMKDMILYPAKGEKSGNELVAQMRQCD